MHKSPFGPDGLMFLGLLLAAMAATAAIALFPHLPPWSFVIAFAVLSGSLLVPGLLAPRHGAAIS